MFNSICFISKTLAWLKNFPLTSKLKNKSRSNTGNLSRNSQLFKTCTTRLKWNWTMLKHMNSFRLSNFSSKPRESSMNLQSSEAETLLYQRPMHTSKLTEFIACQIQEPNRRISSRGTSTQEMIKKPKLMKNTFCQEMMTKSSSY